MSEKTFASAFAEKLRERRIDLGLTQKKLGELLGYSEKSVSKWERGEVIAPSNILPLLARTLETSIDYLLCAESEPEYFLGVDGGGTKSEFVVCDISGRKIARTLLGACNPVDLGIDAAIAVLKEGIDSVLQGILPSKVSAFVGIAGGISGDYKERIAAFLEKYRFAYFSNGSDAQNAVAAALGENDGIAVIAGTGSIAFVKNKNLLTRIGGFGYLLDEGGNGFSLGQAAIRAALNAEQESAQYTLLLPLVKEKCGRETVLSAIADFYNGGKREIASYATCVFEAVDKGDATAKKILEDNAKCIANLIESAGKKIPLTKITTVIVGGLTARADLLLPLIKENISDPDRFEISMSDCPPVLGAILLAGGKYNA